MANTNLANAKTAKNDEFYTLYADIQKEINAYLEFDPNVFCGKTVLLPCDDPEWSNFTRFFAQNFEKLRLKRLISTSYAPESKKYKLPYQPTLFETQQPYFDNDKSKTHGKLFVLDRDVTGDNHINIDDLQWQYLKGDGDFRSKEISKLRDEADIIVTNPPFSLFREFVAWLMEKEKKFIIIGNKNCITYKEIFPLIKDNIMWLGKTPMSQDLLFEIPKCFESSFIEKGNNGSNYKIVDGKIYGRSTSIWLTNIDHGRRHERMQLMSMQDNIRFSKHKRLCEMGYLHYENYDAIDIPYTDAIPADYEGNMGVPITFLDKYCPEQFEILGITDRGNEYGIKTKEFTPEETPLYGDLNRRGAISIDGQLKATYARILIRKKQ